MTANYGSNRNSQNSGLSVTPNHVLDIIETIREQFEETVKAEGSSLQFNSEKVFFTQKLIQNDYLCKLCFNNPEALKNAFLSVAATGLTMDPTQKLAWIIPQKGSPVYDISYRGMIRVAVDSNIVADAVVDLVFSNDSFKSNGLRSSPTHEYDPFCTKGALIMAKGDHGELGERGTFRGAYVDYRLPDGSTLVHFVPKDEIAALRALSKSWASVKDRHSSPWATFPWAMVRKSIVRSGNNILPIRSNKLDRLVHMLDQNEGLEPNNAEAAGMIAGEATATVRQGLMIVPSNAAPEMQQPSSDTQSTAVNRGSSNDGSQQASQEPAKQSTPNAQQPTQSTSIDQVQSLAPALIKRLESIAARAAKTKNFSAAFQHIAEMYEGEALAHVTSLVTKARHEYASNLIQQTATPGAYKEALEFAETLPDGKFKENFATKIDETVKEWIAKLIAAAEAGSDAEAIEYLDHMPDSANKTLLSSGLYALA